MSVIYNDQNGTPEECTHNCDTCGLECSSNTSSSSSNEFDFRAYLAKDAKVKHVYAVMSGKGGVGKSLVTGLLASAFEKEGYKTAILDADITGPSIPRAFGVDKEIVEGTEDGSLMFPVRSMNGTQIISANLLLQNEDDPIIWRGSLIASCVKQFYSETLWKDVDYMFVDMPPGTGDVPLTVFQSLPIDGVIIVTSPQDMVSMIVGKSINMCKKMNLPVIGIIENMSYVECPDCGRHISIFGESHIDEVAAKYDLKVLAKIPVDPKIAQLVDAGKIEYIDPDYMDEAIDIITVLDSVLG